MTGTTLKKVLNDLTFLTEHTKHINRDNFNDDEILRDSIMFRMIQISENSARLTDEFKSSNRNIPWSAIKGLRNRLVHEYGNVDYTIICDTVTNDIPQLLAMICELYNKQTQ